MVAQAEFAVDVASMRPELRRAHGQRNYFRRVRSYHSCTPIDLRKCFADAHDGQFRHFRGPEVDQQNMILPGFHEFAELCFQLGTAPPRNEALKECERTADDLGCR